ncbi:uncharacterized protein PGRI_016820 [Penicillium griseofulvum]|uniref:Uncharacterized protein n=1 Tax=Penicillium patulum TaxID=5078 RepID=A0A135LFQ7_PENPA|nr:uncharacterized protein PGRI_016820 [Penicillium griseofulvum]KXG47812.1 hypothetical protein PGRI_016820 [Penicillium griseofulvum]
MSSTDAYKWEQVEELYGAPITDLQITPQRPVMCYVSLDHGISRPLVVVDEWISENYLIWTLCAAFAKHGSDRIWTRRFDDSHRDQWVQIKEIVRRMHGADRFLLDIPPPPLLLAVFQVRDSQTSSSHSHAIMATPASPRSRGGLLRILRHVYHGNYSPNDVFSVVLYDSDVTGVAPQSPPLALLGLQPDSSDITAASDIPPPYELASEPDLSGLGERLNSPPPPYRTTSPAPPGWTP